MRGRRIGAAPWVDLGLRRLLIEAGIDPVRDVTIAPIPGTLELKVNTGVMAAQALEDRVVDGFWANGMGAELAMRRGVATLVLDVRRGDGPKGCFDYTMATVAAADALVQRSPETAAAAIRALVATQAALRRRPGAGEQGRSKAVPRARGGADRRPGGQGRAVLPGRDLGSELFGHEPVRARCRHPRRISIL